MVSRAVSVIWRCGHLDKCGLVKSRDNNIYFSCRLVTLKVADIMLQYQTDGVVDK